MVQVLFIFRVRYSKGLVLESNTQVLPIMLCSVVINWNDQENKSPTLNKRKIFCHHIVFLVWFGVAFEEKVIRTTSISCSNGVFRTKKKLQAWNYQATNLKSVLKKIYLRHQAALNKLFYITVVQDIYDLSAGMPSCSQFKKILHIDWTRAEFIMSAKVSNAYLLYCYNSYLTNTFFSVAYADISMLK